MGRYPPLRSGIIAMDRVVNTHPGRRPVRVLHIIQNLNYGGMERLLSDLIRHADTSVISPEVMALEYPGRFAAELHDRLAPPVQQSKASLLWPRNLSQAIRQRAPDVVHAHSGVWFKASRAARLAGVARVLYTEHGRKVPDSLLQRTLDRMASRRTESVIAVSEPVREYLTRHVV